MYIRINQVIVKNRLGKNKEMRGRGLTDKGEATLRREVAHEFGHSLGLIHDFKSERNVMYQIAWENFVPSENLGFEINLSQMLKIIDNLKNSNKKKVNVGSNLP